MRTSLTIDPDVLSVAKRQAAARSRSVSKAIPGRARKGLAVQALSAARRGFPVFKLPAGASAPGCRAARVPWSPVTDSRTG
jgi:hypothetical protein